MSGKMSVEEVLANLERQVAFHREQEAEHARQEAWHEEQAAFHKEQRALHAAEHEAVARHYEAFKATAGTATEIAARVVAAPPPPAPEEPSREEAPLKGPIVRSRLVTRWVEGLAVGEVFGPTRAAAEVNRRHGRQLSKPATFKLASAALRRLHANGTIRLVRQGTAHHESLYTKG